MSDDLIISGGGSVVVASDSLLAQSEALIRLVGELDGLRGSVVAAGTRVTMPRLRALDAPLSAVAAENDITTAIAVLTRAQFEAWVMATGLRLALERYGRNEDFTAAMAQQLSARMGHGLGFLAPLIAITALPSLGAVAGGTVVAGLVTGYGPDLGLRGLGAWIRENNEVLTNPTTVALVRAAVSSSDDFLGGLLRLPAELVAMLGDEGLGLTGLSTAAAVVTLVGRRGGLLRETPVTATLTGTAATVAPSSLADRVARIPRPGQGSQGEQIRIEKYSQPGEVDRFEVYLAGTVDFGITAGTQPFDMTSNLSGIAGLPAGSADAVRQAMADAGITQHSPIVFTGYSQGGMVASLLAASEQYNVQGLVTVGAPAGQVDVPASVPILTIRHTDDLVPALGGYDINPHALVVEREAFGGTDIPPGFALPAHQIDQYDLSAALIDEATSSALRDSLSALNSFGTTAAVGVSASYVAKRTG
ncbi:MAG TPA: hypothetical protein VGP24_01905 [Glaciihabitans sp.]|nr:hypothetical protein [Glaciihabitans sp.]